MAKEQKQLATYWFKRRRYGWGWVPVTWQGWTTIVGFLGIIIVAAATQLPAKPEQPSNNELVNFFVIFMVALLLLLIISIAKGPAPHWRWGKKPSDDPKEDY